MPRYAYRCSKCSHEVEETRKVEDRDRMFKCGMKFEDKPCLGTYEKIPALTGSPVFKGAGFTQKFYR